MKYSTVCYILVYSKYTNIHAYGSLELSLKYSIVDLQRRCLRCPAVLKSVAAVRHRNLLAAGHKVNWGQYIRGHVIIPILPAVRRIFALRDLRLNKSYPRLAYLAAPLLPRILVPPVPVTPRFGVPHPVVAQRTPTYDPPLRTLPRSAPMSSTAFSLQSATNPRHGIPN